MQIANTNLVLEAKFMKINLQILVALSRCSGRVIYSPFV